MYAGKNILYCRVTSLLSKFVLTVAAVGITSVVGMNLLGNVEMDGYVVWMLWGCVVTGCMLLVAMLVCRCIYPQEVGKMIRTIRGKIKSVAKKIR